MNSYAEQRRAIPMDSESHNLRAASLNTASGADGLYLTIEQYKTMKNDLIKHDSNIRFGNELRDVAADLCVELRRAPPCEHVSYRVLMYPLWLLELVNGDT